MEAMRVYHQLNEDGEVHLKGLPYKKGEEVELILIPAPKKKAILTARKLLESDIIGLWSNHEIEDSAVYARQLREQAQRR